MSSVLRVRGVVLPEGEHRDLYVADGTITYDPIPADVAAEGWIVPGLVDAHCHIGLEEDGPTDDAHAEEQAIQDRDGGTLLIRDCGSALGHGGDRGRRGTGRAPARAPDAIPSPVLEPAVGHRG